MEKQPARKPLPFVLCLAVAMVPVLAQAGPPSTEPPSVQTIAAGMARARGENRAGFRPYVVTRDYKLFSGEQDTIKSQVVADITFFPPNVKNYVIEKSSGAGLGERAVRRILQSEAEAAKDYDATDYSSANYQFRYIGDEQDAQGQHNYVLEMLPRREDRNLLQGRIWVDAATFRVRRVEGGPSKPTSWWVRDVHIVLLYSEVHGMWLQTDMEATAKVRLLGPHRLVSSDLKYQFYSVVASERTHQPTETVRAASPSEMAGRNRTSDLPLGKGSLPWNLTKPFGSLDLKQMPVLAAP